MPGELANCIAGRIANVYNFHGPNYVCDAACASAMAAISVGGRRTGRTRFRRGGHRRHRPQHGRTDVRQVLQDRRALRDRHSSLRRGADGFVMGEGAAIFLLKRLADAERDGDKIYAVLRGIGGSSDGKGKGITAPNPIGQKFCLERAWQNAGLSPATGDADRRPRHIDSRGRCGRSAEHGRRAQQFSISPPHSVALGSVKSNFGHLKGAAGAAGLLKAALALHDKVLPPSVHCEHPNPDIDFAHSPLYVNTELKPWDVPTDGVRRAG